MPEPTSGRGLTPCDNPLCACRDEDTARRVARTLAYVDELLSLPGLNSTTRTVCEAVRRSLTTPARTPSSE